jgi:Tfp pilus assembly protein PilO
MRLNLKTVRAEKMMEVLHPTAALGGWPREEAHLLLQSFDSKKSREYFGAPFCFESLEKIFCVVMIRGLQWKSNKVFIRAGCGVVEQSKFENEFKEVCLKTKAIEEKLSDNIEKLNKQKKLLKEYELEIGRIPLAIPEKANEDQFIKIAQFAGGKSAITISKIDFEYAKEKVSFDMAVEGSYANILKFIEMINLAPRIIHVETVTMAKSKEESFTGLVISSIKGKFFILPKQKEPENGDNKQ